MTKSLILSIMALALAGVVAGGALFTVYQGQKTANIQGCMQVAQGKTITNGTSEGSQWTVEQPQLNDQLLQTCLTKKGL